MKNKENRIVKKYKISVRKNYQVIAEEVNNASKEMKRNKAAGPDGILSEMLLEAKEDLKQELVKLFNMYLETGKIPTLCHNQN